MILLLHIIGLIALWFYVAHKNDVWYVFGIVIGKYYTEPTFITYDNEFLTIKSACGRHTDMYQGLVAKSVYKALIKSNIKVEEK